MPCVDPGFQSSFQRRRGREWLFAASVQYFPLNRSSILGQEYRNSKRVSVEFTAWTTTHIVVPLGHFDRIHRGQSNVAQSEIWWALLSILDDLTGTLTEPLEGIYSLNCCEVSLKELGEFFYPNDARLSKIVHHTTWTRSGSSCSNLRCAKYGHLQYLPRRAG